MAMERGLMFLVVAILLAVSKPIMVLLLLIFRASNTFISSVKLMPSPYKPVHAMSVFEPGNSIILEVVVPEDKLSLAESVVVDMV